jgi:hypothetical protein
MKDRVSGALGYIAGGKPSGEDLQQATSPVTEAPVVTDADATMEVKEGSPTSPQQPQIPGIFVIWFINSAYFSLY